jgi:hypothetical protein
MTTKAEMLRVRYPPGTLLRLIEWSPPDDEPGVPPGSLGAVSSIDDLGTIHMIWETGNRIGLLTSRDKFEEVG